MRYLHDEQEIPHFHRVFVGIHLKKAAVDGQLRQKEETLNTLTQGTGAQFTHASENKYCTVSDLSNLFGVAELLINFVGLVSMNQYINGTAHLIVDVPCNTKIHAHVLVHVCTIVCYS